MKAWRKHSIVRSTIAFLLLVGLPLGVRAQEFAYVANYNSGDVSGYTVDPTTGTLIPILGSPFTAGAGTSSVVANPTGQFVYAANRNSNNVSAYRIDASTGVLTPIPGSPFPAGVGPVGATVSPTGKFLFVANCGGGGSCGGTLPGSVSGYTIDATTGVLTPVPGSPFPTGSNSEAVSVDPSGTFAYVANAGSNDVSAYRIDASTGALTPIPGSPFAAQSFPAWLTIDPRGHFLYVTNHLSNDISVYMIDGATGVLTPIPGSPFAAGSGPWYGVLDSSGHFFYMTNGSSSNVSAYTIDATTGALTQIANSPFPAGSNTNAVALDPTGHFAYAANFSSNNLSAYSINNITGDLSPIQGSPFTSGSGPSWVAITHFNPYTAAIAADHPVAYYRLGELPGSTTAVDASGNGHIGVYEGNPVLGVTGLIHGPDNAVNFNTTGDVRIANALDMNFVGTPFTIEAWVSGISGASYKRIFDKSVVGLGLGYGLDIYNANIRLLGSTSLNPFTSFSPTATYHLVGVSDGAGSGSIYVNGTLLASGPYSSLTANTGEAHIAVANDGSAHFDGTIDEVAVYNYALPVARILAHYSTGARFQQAGTVILTIATDSAAYATGQAVNISGQFLDSNGLAISNVTIGIQITQGATSHSLSAVTNTFGNYTVAYQPLPSEVGVFQTTATGLSGGVTTTATTSFQIFGAPTQVPSGSLPPGNTTWGQTGVAYVIANGGLTVPAGSTLTILPGVVVKFKTNVNLSPTYLNIGGTLVANGTAQQPITFTSYRDDTVAGDTNGDGAATTPAAGDWGFIQFSPGATGSVSFAVVRYGGSQWFPATNGISEIGALAIATQTAQPTLANLTVTDNITGIGFWLGGTTATVTASTFTRNTNGVHVFQSAAPTITGATFTDNTNAVWGQNGSAATVTGGTITTSSGLRQTFLSEAGFRGTYSGNTVSGSGIALVETQAGNMQGANAWSQVGIPYVIDNGGLVAPNGTSLTISPGVVVKFKTNVNLSPTYLNIVGSLTANGTASQPITFTSYRDDTAIGDTNGDGSNSTPAPGDWGFIQFAGGATGSVNFAVVRYGGSQWFPATNGVIEVGALEIWTQTAQPTLANLTVTDNITGIRFDIGGTTATVTASTFTRNTNGVHVVGGAAPIITGATFTDNTNAVWEIGRASCRERV